MKQQRQGREWRRKIRRGRNPGGNRSRPGPAVDKSDQRVRAMFASIARRYDLLNHLLSLNIDRSWRRFTTRCVPPEPGVPVLDCCTGTADLALEYHRASRGLSPVIGSDFCHEMLHLGHLKVQKAGASRRMSSARRRRHSATPPSGRNLRCRHRRLRPSQRPRYRARESTRSIRVARPGGTVAILEFSRPRRSHPGAALPRLLPQGAAARRSGTRPERPGGVPLPAGQCPAVSRRSGHARPPRLARPDLGPSPSADPRESPRSTSVWETPSRCPPMTGPDPSGPPIVLAMTGASGAPYAVALLRTLTRGPDRPPDDQPERRPGLA